MNYSICCLIYRSIPWLEFVYRQVRTYTDLYGHEFFFMANDATPEVLAYLKAQAIPHHLHTNTPEQRGEWFINNVYRAYNAAAAKAGGDFLVFINSDMAFSPGWMTNLAKAYNGSNCLTSRLVESGRLTSGQYGIEQNFGSDYTNYQEAAFLSFCERTAEAKIAAGGLYMPLLIRRADFLKVGGYPPGNLREGSDLFQPELARPGEPCLTGDLALMGKLATLGISHQTVFDSLVYHFQQGESRS